MSQILVTGTAGFIGSHLAERLLKEGHTVIGVDNFVTGSRSNVERLEKIAGNQDGSSGLRFTFHEFDVSDSGIVEFLKSSVDGGFDQIYHLACPASPIDFKDLGIEILETCAKGTMHMLDLAAHTGARFLYTSTSEVYGDPLEHPQTESYLGNVSTLGPRSCYDEGKRFSESYIVHYSNKHNVDFRIARIFNTYGPYMRKDDGRVIPNFIEQVNAGNPLTIYGDGSQTRSFCYVEDMVRGLMLLMNYEKFDQNDENDAIERVFNLGNPHEISILELAETLVGLVGGELRTTTCDLPKDDPKKRCPNIERAQKLLGFTPQVDLQSGLARTLELWN